MDALLTAAERQELVDRPISEEWHEFTEEQIRARIEIGRKLNTVLIEDPETPPWARVIYEQYPPWGFYKMGENSRVRIYGAMENGRVHGASAHLA